MASLIAKKKGNQLYHYVIESARVDGQPRIVHQAYLGTAEKLAAMVRDRTGVFYVAWKINARAARCLQRTIDELRAAEDLY